jgi:serine/threonine protein kinase
MGTAAYMSPEQARGLEVDERTDLWSLGAVLYEMAAGAPPFVGQTSSDVMTLVLTREPEPLPGPSDPLSAEFQRIVTKALSKKRGDRYQSAGELLLDLEGLRRALVRLSGRTRGHSPRLRRRLTRAGRLTAVRREN